METGDIRGAIDIAVAEGEAAEAAGLLKQGGGGGAAAALAGFVTSRFDRLRDTLGLATCRVALLRSFTVEPAVPILRAMAYTRGIAVDWHLGEFNAYAQEILDPDCALYRFRPDAAILAVQTRDIAPD